MADAFYMPDPVLVHNAIPIYNAYHDDNLSDPSENWFTTNPYDSYDYLTHGFDVRDYAHLAPEGASTKEILIAITEHPEILPLEDYEKLDDICMGFAFFHSTPEQDSAFELAAKISAQMDNYWPAISVHNQEMPDGTTKGVYVIPKHATNEGFDMHVYNHKLDYDDFKTMVLIPQDYTVEHKGNSTSDLIRSCCDALGVDVPEHLRQPLAEKLTAAHDQANQDPQSPDRTEPVR